MLIEDYKRINGWLNIRINPIENQSLYDFSEYLEGKYYTLSEAHELYNQYINNQPERTSNIHADKGQDYDKLYVL